MLMKVPRTESKLRVSGLRKSLNIVNSAVEQESFKFSSWDIDLEGSTIGFKLDSLLTLADTLVRNNRMTLMHYLCKVLISFRL
ncbi:putative formin, FH2 domain-containing protein [Helianthus anomalus]